MDREGMEVKVRVRVWFRVRVGVLSSASGARGKRSEG
jgi:hypothetical protein